MLFTFYLTPKEMIKKDKNGITACSLQNCCLTGNLEGDNIKLTNEKGEELTCSIAEFAELAQHLHIEEGMRFPRLEKGWFL